MATDPRKRQKQHARKVAKRKATLTTKRSGVEAPGGMNAVRLMRVAAAAPLHECLMGRDLFEMGIGTVVVSRELPNGRMGAAFFLLDVFCLGVKNADFLVATREEYSWRLEHMMAHETLLPIAPEYARKLVEAAEAYARDLGFSPHPDYQLSRKIFADIDATACPATLTCGKDGQPFYAAGPYDTPQRVHNVLQTLTKRCGPDGFHYLLPLEGMDAWDDKALADERDGDEMVIEAEYTKLEE